LAKHCQQFGLKDSIPALPQEVNGMSIHFRPQQDFTRIIELTPALRRRIEATIEHLLSILDQFDGDENLEDGADHEPWLSSGAADHKTAWRDDRGDDRELDTADDEDGGDMEPTLGAPEKHPRSEERHLWAGVYDPRLLEPGTWPVRRVREASQEDWADGRRGDHEREVENEHGVEEWVTTK
jgi:hypothetical protein